MLSTGLHFASESTTCLQTVCFRILVGEVSPPYSSDPPNRFWGSAAHLEIAGGRHGCGLANPSPSFDDRWIFRELLRVCVALFTRATVIQVKREKSNRSQTHYTQLS